MVVELDGLSLHYEMAGEGTPLLWLHGFLGAGPDWRHLFPEPPPGYRIVAPDLRGHGRSTNPAGTFTFRQAARDVRALLRHLGLGPVKAIGLSGGGLVLLHLATREPSLVASMVLISAPPYFPAQARAIQRQTSDAMFGEAELTQMRRRHAGGGAQLQGLIEQARAFADSYDDVSFTPPHLATIAADTLVVFGDRDPLYPVSLAFDLHAAIPRSSLWVVPNGGHGPVFGPAAPQAAATILAFLGGEWPRPAA